MGIHSVTDGLGKEGHLIVVNSNNGRLKFTGDCLYKNMLEYLSPKDSHLKCSCMAVILQVFLKDYICLMGSQTEHAWIHYFCMLLLMQIHIYCIVWTYDIRFLYLSRLKEKMLSVGVLWSLYVSAIFALEDFKSYTSNCK